MKKFYMLFLMTVMFLVGINGVKAESVNIRQDFIKDVWSFHYRNGKVFTFGNLPYNYANNNLVFCIQPDAKVVTNTYNVYNDFTKSGYSNEEKTKMELIAYYGYNYPGHNTLKYYMATQELLWLFSSDERIKWTKGNTDDTEEININNEKNEIQRLVNNHNVLPSFAKQKYNIEGGEELKLTDKNNVLNNYNITSSSIKPIINGNNITIKGDKIEKIKFNITPKYQSNNKQTLIYDDFSIRTQTLASFSNPKFISGEFEVDIDKIPINIYKKDMDTKELITNSGIKIKIKDLNNNTYVGEYEFKDGKINIKLPVGKYQIEEISTVSPYILNNQKIDFEIKNNDGEKNIDFFNKEQKGKINIKKTNEENEKLDNVEFEIYNDKNELVDKLITKDGVATSKELPLGKYILKETKELYGYVKDNKIYNATLDYNNLNKEIVTKDINVVNRKIKCDVTYITTGDNKNINVSFNIYNDKNKLVYSGKTIDGKISIPLTYGNYIIKEINVPNGYKLNNKEVKFTVNDKTCASTLKMDNEKVNMPITTSESNLVYLCLLLFNISGYVFIKKNS